MDTENNYWDTKAGGTLKFFKKLAKDGDPIAKRAIERIGKIVDKLDDATEIEYYVNFKNTNQEKLKIEHPIWKVK